MTVSLGIPAMPPPVLAPRRATRQIDVGGILVGGGAPISVQSMTTTVTSPVSLLIILHFSCGTCHSHMMIVVVFRLFC